MPPCGSGVRRLYRSAERPDCRHVPESPLQCLRFSSFTTSPDCAWSPRRCRTVLRGSVARCPCAWSRRRCRRSTASSVSPRPIASRYGNFDIILGHLSRVPRAILYHPFMPPPHGVSCLFDVDSCLQSDIVPDSRLQGKTFPTRAAITDLFNASSIPFVLRRVLGPLTGPRRYHLDSGQM